MNPIFAARISNFGDTGVILPLSAVLIAALWHQESVRSAWLLARSIIGCLAIMALLKIFFLSCGHSLGTEIRSPSGHTSLTTFFYGALATLVWARKPGPLGLVAVIGAALLALGVAVSRLVLDAHNLQEVIFGGSVGALLLASFALPYLRQPHPQLRLHRLALFLVPFFLLTYGTVLPAERMLQDFFRLGICTP